MAIEDIVGAALHAVVELIGAAIYKDKKPIKKQIVTGWIIVFLLVALLIWFTVTYS